MCRLVTQAYPLWESKELNDHVQRMRYANVSYLMCRDVSVKSDFDFRFTLDPYLFNDAVSSSNYASNDGIFF
jgi:hypothetical protein